MKAGISLRALATHLGCSASYVSDIELGRRGSNAGLKKLALQHISAISRTTPARKGAKA